MGYEINFSRYFYVYSPPRSPEEIVEGHPPAILRPRSEERLKTIAEGTILYPGVGSGLPINRLPQSDSE